MGKEVALVVCGRFMQRMLDHTGPQSAGAKCFLASPCPAIPPAATTAGHSWLAHHGKERSGRGNRVPVLPLHMLGNEVVGQCIQAQALHMGWGTTGKPPRLGRPAARAGGSGGWRGGS